VLSVEAKLYKLQIHFFASESKIALGLKQRLSCSGRRSDKESFAPVSVVVAVAAVVIVVVGGGGGGGNGDGGKRARYEFLLRENFHPAKAAKVQNYTSTLPYASMT
jgi:hypothetical protein